MLVPLAHPSPGGLGEITKFLSSPQSAAACHVYGAASDMYLVYRRRPVGDQKGEGILVAIRDHQAA
jgi:hypothetical protein